MCNACNQQNTPGNLCIFLNSSSESISLWLENNNQSVIYVSFNHLLIVYEEISKVQKINNKEKSIAVTYFYYIKTGGFLGWLVLCLAGAAPPFVHPVKMLHQKNPPANTAVGKEDSRKIYPICRRSIKKGKQEHILIKLQVRSLKVCGLRSFTPNKVKGLIQGKRNLVCGYLWPPENQDEMQHL